MKHNSVLLDEVIEKLKIKKNGIYVDATLGLGGHTKAILKSEKKIQVIAFDLDINAIEYSKKELNEYKNVYFFNRNFSNLRDSLKEINITKVDGILFDLGTSYYQLTDKDRGFTYHGENLTLDMRMDPSQKKTAIDVLNNYDLKSLEKIFYDYGDEKKARMLAQEIINYRQEIKITTNSQLNEIIKKVKGWDKNKHPSKNIYQAIRIEVNNEILNLKLALKQALELLNINGRLLVITFHSLEDKTVKEIFWEHKNIKKINEFEISQKFHTYKTVYVSKKEKEENNSSRTAKLRVIKKNYE